MNRGALQPIKPLSNEAQPDPNASQVSVVCRFWAGLG